MSLLLAAACAAGPGGEDGTDGKADDAGDKAGACFREYSLWLDEDFRPALARRPLDAAAVRRVAAANPCDDWEAMAGSPAFDSWRFLYIAEVWAPYRDRYVAAFEGYHAGDDHHSFVAKVQPTPELRLAHELAMLARPAVADRLGYHLWLGFYVLVVSDLTIPLDREGRGAFEEGFYDLNPSEVEMLDLVEAGRPRVIGDGGFADWIDELEQLIYHGTQVHQDDDYSPHVASTPARDALVERFIAMRPPAVGERDHGRWMHLFALAVTVSRLDSPVEAAQLAIVESVTPSGLRGDEAYRVWLETYEELLADAAKRERHVLPVKPCVASVDATSLYDRFRARHGDVAEALLAAAAPRACR